MSRKPFKRVKCRFQNEKFLDDYALFTGCWLHLKSQGWEKCFIFKNLHN